MSKATEKKLSKLHGDVAEVLSEQVTYKEKETTFDIDGNEEPTGVEKYTASPALMATAIKFLKDNDITCDVEQEENLGALKKALSEKPKHSRMKLVNGNGAATREV